jgi:two-component system NarL family sensor kinase
MQLLQLQDEERRRIGRELHDGMAQTVLAVNLSLAQVRQSSTSLGEPAERALEKARVLLQQMSREIRTLSYLLHPPLLDELGLVSALKEYVRGFSERSGIETELVFPKQFSRLPQFVEIALFRVVQESLANIQRHSGSDSATIRLREDPPAVTLEIIDYGRGMKLASNGPAQPNVAHLGVGIPGMRERMAQLGGRLEIESGPAGTTVRATISSPEGISKEPFDGPPSHPDRG